MKKRIVFTGGGSAGHVLPNLPLMEQLALKDWQVTYVGQRTGIEADLLHKTSFEYRGIVAGKLRRYLSWRHFSDPFKVLTGIIMASYHLWRIKPQVVFAKGGFVSVPVVIAAWMQKIPVLIHESDVSPGLANRLCARMSRYVCVNFEASRVYFKQAQTVEVTGTPIRSELLSGDAQKGLELCGFHTDMPVLLVMGGSLGSQRINQVVRDKMDILLTQYQIIHLCGAHDMKAQLEQPGYHQIGYAKEELPHLLACSNLVLSRAGAGAIMELIALRKPHILVPLSSEASRGEQLQNAQLAAREFGSIVLFEQKMNDELVPTLEHVRINLADMIDRVAKVPVKNATAAIIRLIENTCHS